MKNRFPAIPRPFLTASAVALSMLAFLPGQALAQVSGGTLTVGNPNASYGDRTVSLVVTGAGTLSLGVTPNVFDPAVLPGILTLDPSVTVITLGQNNPVLGTGTLVLTGDSSQGTLVLFPNDVRPIVPMATTGLPLWFLNYLGGTITVNQSFDPSSPIFLNSGVTPITVGTLNFNTGGVGSVVLNAGGTTNWNVSQTLSTLTIADGVGVTFGVVPAGSSAPEPASAALLLSGGLALLARRRR
jgi:hypothetical protein